jgi:serine protease SohB
MEFVTEYGLFLAKTITVVIAVLIIAGASVALSSRGQTRSKEHIKVKHLNRHYEAMANVLYANILSKKAVKEKHKALKKRHKAEAQGKTSRHRRMFVLNFHGDIRASALNSLRQEITALLTVATPDDEVVVRLDSPGGLVTAYGLAASQLLRIKHKGLQLTVAVDKVAASGGYLMACVADRIIAAPFAIVGSIGVVAQMPNFHRLLNKNEIDFEQFTAGEYKRTVTLFGENTDKGRQKLQQEIEQTHGLFKEFVSNHRSVLDIPQVATGEHWYGTQALDLKLVDELRTSDDYLLEASQTAELFEVTHVSKKPLMAKLFATGDSLLQRLGFVSVS